MNGRVEDAITGQFLSPDPQIPDPTNTQSYNRYAYTNNNPLTMVDPTGFDEKLCPDSGCGGGGFGFGAQGTPEQSSWNCYGDCGTAGGWANSITTTVTSPGASMPMLVGALHGINDFQSAFDNSVPNSLSQLNSSVGPPQGGSNSWLSSAATGVLDWTEDAAIELGVDLGAVLTSTLTGASGVLMLAPTATATQDDDSGQVFYHGTATFSGGPLDAGSATANANGYGSSLGFYLASDPDTAVHFAAVAAGESGNNPMVLQYYINNTALTGLQEAGAVLGPIPGGPTNSTTLPGQQLFVPPQLFRPLTGIYCLGGSF